MRRGVRTTKLKHLNPAGTFPSGNTRFYYRPKGQKGIPMPDLPTNDPKFLAAYVVAAGDRPRSPTVTGSIAAAITAYKKSDSFMNGLAASTRSTRRRILDDLAERYGHGRLADLQPRHIQADLDRFSGHVANGRLRVWRGLCAWLVETSLVKTNPSEGLRRKKVAKSEGHVPWSRSEVLQFREHWPIGTPARLLFELLHWTGARVSDAIRFGEGNIDRDGWLVFCQQKTGGEVSVPVRRALPEFAEGMADDLEQMLRAIDARSERHLTFLTTSSGKSRSSKSVSQWFAAKVRAAGIVDRTAHGLRKTRAIALVEAEATHHQVGAWTGHESLKEIERYAKKFDRRKALSRSDREHRSSNFLDRVPNRAGM